MSAYEPRVTLAELDARIAALQDYRELLVAYLERRDEALALRSARDSVAHATS